MLAPVEVRVPMPPQVFTGSDGARHLAYELHITNFYADTGSLRLDGIDVFDADAATPLLHLSAVDLAGVSKPQPKEGAHAVVDAGKRLVVYLWLTLPADASAPKRLRHHLDLAAAGKTFVVDGAPLTVDARAVPVLGAPLRGGRWLAHEGPGAAQSHHWGSLVAINGSLTIPQRFALDLVGVDDAGRALKPGVDLQKTTHRDWVGYGADVLAVADGTVVSARDGEAEHPPLTAQPEPKSLATDDLFGNYVVIDIGSRAYAGYAHLARGSVRVKAGDRVRAGQVIGRLGQSGNSAAPHLHFQLANAPTFEGSEGIPYVFAAYTYYGPETEAQLFGQGEPWRAAATDARKAQLPLNDVVVGFPQQ
jgi:murein DD-endopeptidase MepM/ murein hydrolase activator NlpD